MKRNAMKYILLPAMLLAALRDVPRGCPGDGQAGPTPCGAEAEAPVIWDRAAALAAADQDEELLHTLVTALRDDLPRLEANLEAGRKLAADSAVPAARTAEALRRAAHALKNSAATLCFEELRLRAAAACRRSPAAGQRLTPPSSRRTMPPCPECGRMDGSRGRRMAARPSFRSTGLWCRERRRKDEKFLYPASAGERRKKGTIYRAAGAPLCRARGWPQGKLRDRRPGQGGKDGPCAGSG